LHVDPVRGNEIPTTSATAFWIPYLPVVVSTGSDRTCNSYLLVRSTSLANTRLEFSVSASRCACDAIAAGNSRTDQPVDRPTFPAGSGTKDPALSLSRTSGADNPL
jgi:hypothetical protein